MVTVTVQVGRQQLAQQEPCPPVRVLGSEAVGGNHHGNLKRRITGVGFLSRSGAVLCLARVCPSSHR